MPHVGRNTSGQIVEERITATATAPEFLPDNNPELLAWRGTNPVDDRPTSRRTLAQKPDAAPVTVRDLKDLGLI